MMDQKRNSVGRVATPKSAAGGLGAQGVTDLDAALLKAIDKKIRITTTIPNSAPLEGVLFTACPKTNLVAINISPNPGPNAAGNYRVIPVSHISNFQILPSSDADGAVASPAYSSFADVVPTISKVDLDANKAREEEAIRKMKEYDGTRGKGVTREAQEIFDWFRRTLPARWNDQQIIVNESVIVNPPYTVNDLRAPKDKQQAEAQIKRVLEGYYSRKKGGNANTAINSSANSGTNTPVGGSRPVVPALPRKGG